MSIKSMLKDEIQSQLTEVGKLQVGSEDYKAAVDGITKLMDRSIEMDKLEIESNERVESRENDTQLKLLQMEADKKDRRITHILTGLGIGIPTATAIWGTIRSIKFEETGSITTIMGRGWISKLIPKK